jgi:hypothetical protein
MSNKSNSSNKGSEGEKSDPLFAFQAMQQQFERMNVMFGEIRDRMERQDAAIAEIQRG